MWFIMSLFNGRRAVVIHTKAKPYHCFHNKHKQVNIAYSESKLCCIITFLRNILPSGYNSNFVSFDLCLSFLHIEHCYFRIFVSSHNVFVVATIMNASAETQCTKYKWLIFKMWYISHIPISFRMISSPALR